MIIHDLTSLDHHVIREYLREEWVDLLAFSAVVVESRIIRTYPADAEGVVVCDRFHLVSCKNASLLPGSCKNILLDFFVLFPTIAVQIAFIE